METKKLIETKAATTETKATMEKIKNPIEIQVRLKNKDWISRKYPSFLKNLVTPVKEGNTFVQAVVLGDDDHLQGKYRISQDTFGIPIYVNNVKRKKLSFPKWWKHLTQTGVEERPHGVINPPVEILFCSIREAPCSFYLPISSASRASPAKLHVPITTKEGTKTLIVKANERMAGVKVHSLPFKSNSRGLGGHVYVASAGGTLHWRFTPTMATVRFGQNAWTHTFFIHKEHNIRISVPKKGTAAPISGTATVYSDRSKFKFVPDKTQELKTPIEVDYTPIKVSFYFRISDSEPPRPPDDGKETKETAFEIPLFLKNLSSLEKYRKFFKILQSPVLEKTGSVKGVFFEGSSLLRGENNVRRNLVVRIAIPIYVQNLEEKQKKFPNFFRILKEGHKEFGIRVVGYAREASTTASIYQSPTILHLPNFGAVTVFDSIEAGVAVDNAPHGNNYRYGGEANIGTGVLRWTYSPPLATIYVFNNINGAQEWSNMFHVAANDSVHIPILQGVCTVYGDRGKFDFKKNNETAISVPTPNRFGFLPVDDHELEVQYSPVLVNLSFTPN